MSIEYRKNNFSIHTDPNDVDIDFVHEYLCYQSYWAEGRPRDVVEKSVQNSICFSVFDDRIQVGFARVVTDKVTFAWLCDVFIDDRYQGLGLGKWLIRSVVNHSDLKEVKYILLATSNAHELYRKYGNFEAIRAIEKWMIRYR